MLHASATLLIFFITAAGCYAYTLYSELLEGAPHDKKGIQTTLVPVVAELATCAAPLAYLWYKNRCRKKWASTK